MVEAAIYGLISSKRPEICTSRKSVTSHELVSDMVEAWTINVFFGGQPSGKYHSALKSFELVNTPRHGAHLQK